MSRFVIALSVVTILANSAEAQKGHSLRSGKVVVDRTSHWENWQFPEGTLTIEDDGVIPRLWSTNTKEKN